MLSKFCGTAFAFKLNRLWPFEVGSSSHFLLSSCIHGKFRQTQKNLQKSSGRSEGGFKSLNQAVAAESGRSDETGQQCLTASSQVPSIYRTVMSEVTNNVRHDFEDVGV